jgi:acyl-CoA-binding protein
MSLRKANPVFIALGLATCAIVLPKLYKKLKSLVGRGERITQEKTDVLIDDDENALLLLSSPFHQAALMAKGLRNLDQTDQLMLYGLFKQAKEGNAPDCKEPSKLNIISWKKFSAWRKFYNMPRHFAMMKYIEVVEHFQSVEKLESKYDISSAGQMCEGGGSEAVLEMMNDGDIDYGDESSVDLSESSSNSDKSNSHKYVADEIQFGIKQSTIDCTFEEVYQEDANVIRAATTGDINLLSQLLLSGVDVNQRDENGQTALHMAADKGMIECVRFLLQAGADPNATDKDGISVLEAGVIGGCIECVKLLLDAGADPDQEDNDGDTPRTCAEDDDNDEMKVLLRTAKRVDVVNTSFGSLKSHKSQFSC